MNITMTLREMIAMGYNIGMDKYDIYVPEGKTAEEVRERIKKKFISRYNNFQIGCELPELFIEQLNAHIELIIPYYNQLYKSEDVKFNPLYNVDMTETYIHEVEEEGENKGNSKLDATNNATNNADGFVLENNTPKAKSSMQELKDNKYLSNATRSLDENKSTGTSNQNSSSEVKAKNKKIETYTRKNEGSSAGLPFSKALAQWRDIMLNTDKQLIEELAINFILLY